jgi:quinohemoprotein amine dehydrogenase alpha subunit
MLTTIRDCIKTAARCAIATSAGLTAWAAAGPADAFERDSLVWEKCTLCHAPDASGRIARVSDIRTTPEEWTVIVDRMRRLHGMPIGKGEMDRLLKELCATQILTPQEQAKVAYLSLWHNSQQVEAPADKEEEKLFSACVRCHTAGKIFSYRMTAAEWAKLRDFHLYVVPTVVYQMREMRWVPEADAMLASLAKKLPFEKAWSAPAAKLAGTWGVFGYEPGRGGYRGEARIVDAGNAEYTLTGSVTYTDGTSASFAGEATLYGGYALRTRTKNNGLESSGAFIVTGDEMRGEWHLPAPDFRTSSATWLRQGDAPKVARVVPAFVLKGERTTLTVEGLNLPDAKPGDVAFTGGAVKVLSVKRVASGALQLEVMSNAAVVGTAKLGIKGLQAGTVTLAPQIDHIAITPPLGRARLSGGEHYPAEGVQFEAIAYAKGSGAKADAVPLGPVAATFRLAEERTRADDDDIVWLGRIQPNGTYLPTGDYGPNATRNYMVENSGLVKIIAQYKRGAQSFRAEAKLVVTVPDYIARIR